MKHLLAALLSLALATVVHAAPATAKPNVRAITAFVRLDRANYEKQIDDAMVVLNSAKAEFAKRGYQTQTVRIVTQPLAELSVKKGFAPNVGPATLHDSDEPGTMRLLAKALETLTHINSSAVIADE